MNPSLDYLFQYPVKNVLVKDDASGYAIVFDDQGEGGGSIIGVEFTTSDEYEVPDLTGKALITVVQSESESRMIFGHVDEKTKNIVAQCNVSVAPTDYFIIDPRFGGEPFYPGRVSVEDSPAETVREQFDGRFADGPDGPEEDEAPVEVEEG